MKSKLKFKERHFLILLATAVFAFSSLIYELVFSTLFSFIFGNTIEMYSLVIGFYLFALGIGSFLFSFFPKNKEKTLINYLMFVELAIIIVSILGFLVVIANYGLISDFLVKLIGFFFVIVIGILSGIELPLLNEIYEKTKKERGFSKVLSVDYFGSLIAGVSFPLILYPNLGIFGTLIFTLSLNMIMTLLLVSVFLEKEKIRKIILLFLFLILFFLLLQYKKVQFYLIKVLIEKMAKLDMDYFAFKKAFEDLSIEVKSIMFSKYQIIYKYKMVFGNKSVYCLGLNGVTQTCSHNYLAHHYSYILPEKLFNISYNGKKALILGGGDGITAKFLLEKNLSKIRQIELDEKVVKFSSQDLELRLLNLNSFKRINITFGDAFLELQRLNETFDLILDDIDISTWENKIKFTSLEFYSLVSSKLKDDGIFITTSLNLKPYFPIDKKTYTLLNNLYKAGFKYVLYFKVSYIAYKNNNYYIIPYEDGLIVTKKKFKTNQIPFEVFKGTVIRIDIKDNETISIKDILDFYNHFYLKFNPTFLKREYSSILYPDYSLLKI